jgi:hypothetical protein
MELLGLIWAASLPHQNAAIRMSQTLSAFAGSPDNGHVEGQLESATLDPVWLRGQDLYAILLLPQGFQPQLQWQVPPEVDWEQWAVTAKVTVVPEGVSPQNSAVKTSDDIENSPVSPTRAFIDTIKTTCPAYFDDIAQQIDKKGSHSWQGSYSIRVNNVTVGTLFNRAVADNIAAQIRQAIATVEENPAALQPAIGEKMASAKVKGKTVFVLTDEQIPGTTFSAAQITTIWINNLRQMFGAAPLGLGETQMVAQNLGETNQVFSGTASWYGPYFHGRLTATGEIFDQHELTAAHKTLPFGTRLKVRNLLNDKTVVVRINDRGPYIGNRSLDLSHAAAQCLDSEIDGVIPYEATILQPGVPQAWRAEELAAEELAALEWASEAPPLKFSGRAASLRYPGRTRAPDDQTVPTF